MQLTEILDVYNTNDLLFLSDSMKMKELLLFCKRKLSHYISVRQQTQHSDI